MNRVSKPTGEQFWYRQEKFHYQIFLEISGQCLNKQEKIEWNLDQYQVNEYFISYLLSCFQNCLIQILTQGNVSKKRQNLSHIFKSIPNKGACSNLKSVYIFQNMCRICKQANMYQIEICLNSYLSHKKKSFKDMEYFIYLVWSDLNSFANLINSHFPPFVIFWMVW